MDNPPVRYFHNRLGYGAGVSAAISEAGVMLRYHAHAPRSPLKPVSATHPAILAAVLDRDGVFMGYHCTFIRPDGSDKAFGDASRIMLGRQTGGSIRLSPQCCAIAEGIETALAFRILHNVPCWSARSASGLEQFQPPHGIKSLIIAADGDPAGKDAAQKLFDRLSSRMRVQVAAAPDGQDWCDVLGDQNRRAAA